VRRLSVSYRESAIHDLEGIYRYVLSRSENRDTAKRFVRRTRARCSRIGDVPNGGRAREDLEPGLRVVPFEHSALIAYKVEPDRVRIVNVFYGGRDYEGFYLGPEDRDEIDELLQSN
jgi:toxin ParE1/3/4